MRERGLTVLFAEKDHMQISFSVENKPLKVLLCLQFFMIAG